MPLDKYLIWGSQYKLKNWIGFDEARFLQVNIHKPEEPPVLLAMWIITFTWARTDLFKTSKTPQVVFKEISA
jgi:hypothetical protein